MRKDENIGTKGVYLHEQLKYNYYEKYTYGLH